MTPSITFDDRGLALQLQQLTKLLGQDATKVVDHAVRVAVDVCWRMTPPTGSKHPVAESPKTARQAGLTAVARDVNRAYTFPGAEGLELIDRSNIKTTKIAKEFWRLVRKGKMDEARKLLEREDIHVTSITRSLNPDHHQRQRDRRGRVRKRASRQLVLTRAEVNQYVKRVQKRVGYARSGWSKTVTNIRARHFPAWVRAHAGDGIFDRGGNSYSPTVVFGNAVPYIQASGRDLRIMARAFDIAGHKLAAEIRVLAAKMAGTFHRHQGNAPF